MPVENHTKTKKNLVSEIMHGTDLQMRLVQQVHDAKFNQPINVEKVRSLIGRASVGAKTKQEARLALKSFLQKRNAIQKKYAAWGIIEKDIGRVLTKSSGGMSARSILKKVTGWSDVVGVVEMVPTKNSVIFLFGEDQAFRFMSKTEFKRPTQFAFVYPTIPPAIMMRKNLWHKKQLHKGSYIYGDGLVSHEQEHVVQDSLPIVAEKLTHKRRKGRQQQLENLQQLQRELSRDIVREMGSNLREVGGMKYLRKAHKKLLPEVVALAENKNDARLFAMNEGGYLRRLYVDLTAVFDLIEYARRAHTVNRRGKRVQVMSRDELIAVITNLRELRHIRQRLPGLIELYRERKKKSK
ncbi:MAG: hypothetical protein HOE11_02915 [Candidatus Diapherotrites archaeon]|jgi:hypothetical protein|nr:hypothetical protein [Candidatus Diapherotrites archaeon]MBT4597012.1 hypothetical protein [Candidatus Diapherotrites archaeon]